MSTRKAPPPPIDDFPGTEYRLNASRSRDDAETRSELRRRATIVAANKGGRKGTAAAVAGCHKTAGAQRSLFSSPGRSPLSSKTVADNSNNRARNTPSKGGKGKPSGNTPAGFFDEDLTTTPTPVKGGDTASVRSAGSSRKSARKKKVRQGFGGGLVVISKRRRRVK